MAYVASKRAGMEERGGAASRDGSKAERPTEVGTQDWKRGEDTLRMNLGFTWTRENVLVGC